MGKMEQLLTEATERMRRKRHLQLLTNGWERRVGIVANERQTGWLLLFSDGEFRWTHWRDGQNADLVLRGKEGELERLFAGNELVYSAARRNVQFCGLLRDQLKLDAILRLVCR